MGLIDGFINLAIDTVSIPLDVVRDVAEGNMNEHTARKPGKLLEDVADMFDGF